MPATGSALDMQLVRCILPDERSKYRFNLRVSVGRGERGLLGDVDVAVLVDVVALSGKAILIAVEVGDNRAPDIGEGCLLNENLSTHARVDARGVDVLVAGAEDVGGTEANRRGAAVDVVPVVVVVRHVQSTLILRAVAVRVADEAGLEVVVELVVGEGQEVRSTLGIEEAVIEILLAKLKAVGGEVAVIDDNIGRRLDIDQVLALGRVVQDKILDDDVLDILKTETAVLETRVTTRSDDGSVAGHLEDVAAVQDPGNGDDTTSSKSGFKLRAGGHRSSGTSPSASRASTETDNLASDSITTTGRGRSGSRAGNHGGGGRGNGRSDSGAVLASEGDGREKRQESIELHLD